MGKHKKNKAKENKDKKTERKPIKRAATGHKYILHTHKVAHEYSQNRIEWPAVGRVECALTDEESIMLQMMFGNTNQKR